VIDRLGHVYEYVGQDAPEYVGTLWLVVGRNALSNTNNGQLWDILPLTTDEGYTDEWECYLADQGFYMRVE